MQGVEPRCGELRWVLFTGFTTKGCRWWDQFLIVELESDGDAMRWRGYAERCEARQRAALSGGAVMCTAQLPKHLCSAHAPAEA